MQVSVTADLSAVGRLAKTLERESATVLRWRVRQAVKDVGEDALRRARSNASWSKRIPGAISLRTSFAARSAGVTMKTDPTKAPHAYFYERGSKGSGGRYIKHPVYGSAFEGASGGHGVRERYDEKGTWRKIPTRPFFFRAVGGKEDEFRNKLKQEIQAALHELGFHG